LQAGVRRPVASTTLPARSPWINAGSLLEHTKPGSRIPFFFDRASQPPLLPRRQRTTYGLTNSTTRLRRGASLRRSRWALADYGQGKPPLQKLVPSGTVPKSVSAWIPGWKRWWFAAEKVKGESER